MTLLSLGQDNRLLLLGIMWEELKVESGTTAAPVCAAVDKEIFVRCTLCPTDSLPLALGAETGCRRSAQGLALFRAPSLPLPLGYHLCGLLCFRLLSVSLPELSNMGSLGHNG